MKSTNSEHHSTIAKSPDIDCLFLNAGIQNPHDLASAQPFDLASFHEEVKVNFSSFVSLVHAFLPYFKKNPNPSSVILYVRSCPFFAVYDYTALTCAHSTGSNLAIIPAASLPAYSASKAALNAFTLCLREQLRHSQTSVIEISPPPVQSKPSIHPIHQ